MDARLQGVLPVTVVEESFGCTSEGLHVGRFSIANGQVELSVISYGGIIQSLVVPDADGRPADVVLGFDALRDYERSSQYFGAIIGRYANRISHARFTLDGRTHQLTANEGEHHLHGGTRGFDKEVWEAEAFRVVDGAGVSFSRLSLAGESGYPGDLAVKVAYTLNPVNELTIDFSATTTAPTIINMTQHTYFDLSGGAVPAIDDHLLTIRADHFTAVDRDLIPTGDINPVLGTPFDFRTAHPIGARLDKTDSQLRHALGYDHNWVLDDAVGDGGANATLHDPQSGRTLQIRTTEPGLQFYSGNRLDGRAGKGGRHYNRRAGLCLETQHFPDSPSHPHFPSTVLRPGQIFRSRTTWTFSSGR